MTANPPAPSVRADLFGPHRRATTFGIVLLVTLVAFEAMGVGTAMPALVADLGGVSLYSWPFVTFMAASVFGTVVGGRWCDAAGPRIPLIAAPLLFGAGLVVAGAAPTMGQLLVGRLLQGFGAGALTVGAFVLIAVVYSPGSRPAVFGLISSAWVLPTLIGPPVSGLITETFSWHWVFFGLTPFVLLALALVLPAVRTLEAPDPDREGSGPRRGLVLAAFGAALGVSALSWAGQQIGVVAAVVALVAIAVLVPALRRLLPAGVVTARKGIPSVVLTRALLAGTFFTLNSFIPLMLTSTHGWSTTAAGVPLITASLGWSSVSFWQARHPDLSRTRLLQVGLAAVAIGSAGLLLVAPTWGIAWLAPVFWAVAGSGMGLGMSSISFLVMQQSAPGEVGFHTSAAQMADQIGTAILIGAGGALIVAFALPSTALPVLAAAMAVLAGIGVLLAGRTAAPVLADA
ncbi:MFS transporter [Actinomycetes bacterium KLBMP 9759]